MKENEHNIAQSVISPYSTHRRESTCMSSLFTNLYNGCILKILSMKQRKVQIVLKVLVGTVSTNTLYKKVGDERDPIHIQIAVKY